jgi:hypothetical protein
MAPATADPAMSAGMTLSGSLAAKERPLRDKGEPENQRRTGGLAFFKIEFALEEEASERQPKRRRHPGSHDRRHRA